MVFVLLRNLRPAASKWPGRRSLALLDAVLWPAIWIALAASLPSGGGVVGPLAVSVGVLFACARASRALLHNERYWFTTWRWGRWAAIVLACGFLIKALLS